MRHVLLYDSGEDVASKAPPHFPAHWARCQEFHDRGLLSMVGTFGDPQTQGSMAVFNTREAAEEFAAGDPFVRHGVVRRWELREWNEAFGEAHSSGAALPIVRRYHGAWTAGRFDEAIELLARELIVEAPINDYATAEAFGEALAGFGELVSEVELISELDREDEAMLLYDVRVEGIGRLRVAEHFTVAAGRITRIRQIHATAALRATGFAPSA